MILVVEDYPSYAEHLIEKLESEGHDVEHAIDLDTAYKILAERPITLVITDFCFPGGNGDDVLVRARSLGIQRVYLNSGMPSMSTMRPEYTAIFQKDDLDGITETINEKA